MANRIMRMVAVGAALVISLAAQSSAEVEIRALSLSGQRLPDGQGTISGFAGGEPYLNNRGEAVFVADVHAPRADMDHHAILRSDAAGEVSQLLRTGEALPGAAAGFGWIYLTGEMCLNDAGQLAFHLLQDARDSLVRGIYRIEPDGAVTPIYLPGQDGISGVPNWPIMNDRGQVVFQVGRDDDDPDDRSPTAIYLADGAGGLSRLAGQDDRVDATHSVAPGLRLGSAVTDDGAISFFAFLNPDDGRVAPSQGVYATSGEDLSELARRGASTGAPEEQWEDLAAVRHTQVNAGGQVVFHGRTDRRPRALGSQRVGWFLHDGEGVSPLVLQGQDAPDGNGSFQRLGTDPSLNDRGQLAFISGLSGTRQPGGDDQGIFVATAGGDVVQVVRSGESAPDGDGEFRGSFSLPTINERGQVAFYAHLTGDSYRGIFVAEPDGTIRPIVRIGQTLAEGRVTDVSFAGNAPGRRGFNDAGQVVFGARVEHQGQEREGIFLATPR